MDSDDAADIQKWLKTVLGEGDYQYEGNKRSLGILKQLMLTNVNMDADAQLLLSDLRQKSMEYRREAKCDKTILAYNGLTPDLLSESGLNSLKTLCKLTEKLRLGPGNFSDSSYMLALCDLQQKLSELRQSHVEKKRILFNMAIDSKSEREMLTNIDCWLDEKVKSSTENTEEETKKAKYFSAKNNSYKTRVAQKNKILTKIGARSSLHHDVLAKFSKEVTELQASTKEIQKKLSTYEKLPPSLSQLNIKVAEKEVELAHLEKKLELLFNQADSQQVL